MLQRSYFAEYERMSRKLLKYRKTPAPLKLIAEYEKTLAALRRHLHQNGMQMPLPKYPYDEEDITTHSHIRDFDSPFPIQNPAYKYKDIWERIDGVKGIQ